MYFTTAKFWSDLTERSVSTAAQAALGVAGAGAVGLLTLDSWKSVAATALGAAGVAVLKAFAVGRGATSPDDAPEFDDADVEIPGSDALDETAPEASAQ